MGLRRTGIRRRKRKGNVEYLAMRGVVAEAAGWRCEARTRACNGQVEQVHHRKGRDGQRLTEIQYLLAVCHPCHEYIHANPSESYERGWMVRRNGA